MAFYLHHFNNLENGLDTLLTSLKDSSLNPFDEQHIVIHSNAMADFLAVKIAQDQGVCANVKFYYPPSFLWRIFQKLNKDLPIENVLSQDMMLWHLMEIIPNFLDDEDFQSIKSYLQDTNQQKMYALAGEIAGLFAKYLLYRGDFLIAFEKGKTDELLENLKKQENVKDFIGFSKDLKWQAKLWQALVVRVKEIYGDEVLKAAHRVYFKEHFCEQIDSISPYDLKKLPQKIMIFALSSLPPFQLEIFFKLAEKIDVELYLLNPSEYFWGDLLDTKKIERLAVKYPEKFAKYLEQKDEFEGNELLATWGKIGKDFYNHLFFENDKAIIETEQYQEARDNSLLDQLKRAIFYLENPQYQKIKGDNSLTVHSCHSKMREVEVLHNELLHIFNENPLVKPSDIVVLSPDIDAYSPYIKAVFDQKIAGEKIPYTIFDRKSSEVHKVVELFLAILDLKNSPFTAQSILDLLHNQVIFEKFDLTVDDLPFIKEWVDSCGIRFGLSQKNSNFNNFNSWEYGLNRMILSQAISQDEGLWQQTLAFDETYGLKSEISAKLCSFVMILQDVMRLMQSDHSIDKWQEKLKKCIDTLFCNDLENQQGILMLYSAIDKITKEITETEFKEPLHYSVIMSALSNNLNSDQNHLSFLLGAVNFCSLQPMRAIPFKVVVLLGMNERDFPRQDQNVSFDLMSYTKRLGDRSKREDDQYLLLEMILSAKEMLYISYVGQSLNSKDELLPSVLISQLADHFGKEVYEKILTKHPMTSFSEANFKEGKHQSFHKQWLDLALQKDQKEITFLNNIDSEISSKIELDDLIAFLSNPIKSFCKHQLGIKIYDDNDELEENEHFHLSGLERYIISDDFMKIEDFDDYFERLTYQGKLPVADFEQLSRDDLENSLKPFYEKVKPFLENELFHLTFEQIYQMECKDITFKGSCNFYQDHNRLMLYKTGSLKTKNIIQMWLYHLILCINANEQKKFFITREKESIQELSFQNLSKEEALFELQKYLDCYLLAQKELSLFVYNGLYKSTKKYGIQFDINTDNVIAKLKDEGYYSYPEPYRDRVLANKDFSEQEKQDILDLTEDLFKNMILSMNLTTD